MATRVDHDSSLLVCFCFIGRRLGCSDRTEPNPNTTQPERSPNSSRASIADWRPIRAGDTSTARCAFDGEFRVTGAWPRVELRGSLARKQSRPSELSGSTSFTWLDSSDWIGQVQARVKLSAPLTELRRQNADLFGRARKWPHFRPASFGRISGTFRAHFSCRRCGQHSKAIRKPHHTSHNIT